MTAFFKSFNKKRQQMEYLVMPHLGYFTKCCDEPERYSPLFGERFTSLQNGFERTAGIITSSLFWLLEIPLSLLSIFVRAIDALCELVKGNSRKARKQAYNIWDEFKLTGLSLLIAVASLFVNLADVGVGIVTTLSDATTAPSM